MKRDSYSQIRLEMSLHFCFYKLHLRSDDGFVHYSSAWTVRELSLVDDCTRITNFYSFMSDFLGCADIWKLLMLDFGHRMWRIRYKLHI